MAVKGREKGVIVCAVMRLDLGFRKVRREKGGMLTQDQNCHADLREKERERHTHTHKQMCKDSEKRSEA